MIGVTIILLFLLMLFIWRFLSNHYSLPCPSWLKFFVEIDNPFCRVARAKAIVEHADIHPGMRVLDAGCGPGRVTIKAAQKVGAHGKVVAMDVQEAMLESVRKKAQGLSNIEYICASLGENKLKKETFDRVLLVMVLGEIVDKQEAFQEIYHSLKKGGILSITETIFDPHFQSRSKVLALAKQVGFKERAHFGHACAFTLNWEK